MTTISEVTYNLLDWHSQIDRSLPWKHTQDPYKIWPYYDKFVKAYPTIQDLAEAPQDDVMNLWQGLGYYSRARNMHHASKVITEKYNGKFPTEYKDVLALKGVGKYTAAAIVSFAFGQRYPVVDGNVLRVISRLHGMTEAIDNPKTIKKIYSLSEKYIASVDPAKYNQAIMDFGALHCKPKLPLCDSCPFEEVCVAKQKELISEIPFKAKKIKKKTRNLHYLHINDEAGCTIIKHRTEKGIWQGLYDMPSIEVENNATLVKSKIKDLLKENFEIDHFVILGKSQAFKHLLTHQTIFAVFHKIETHSIKAIPSPFKKIRKHEIEDYAIPKLLVNYIENTK